MRRAAPFVLPTLHLLLCLAIGSGLVPYKGEWSVWFFVYLLDLPVSILALLLHPIPPVISFGVIGTAWWYLLSRLVIGLGRRSAWRSTHGTGPG